MPGRTVLGMLVENEQIMHFRRVVIFELINLLLRNCPLRRQMRGGWVLLVLIQALHAHLSAVMRKFAAAIIEAGKWANKNHAASAKILEKYAGIPIPPNYTRVTYAERLRAADAQPVLDMLATYGVIKPNPRAADLFSPTVYAP